jgi:Glycine-rich domain-containing protein-like
VSSSTSLAKYIFTDNPAWDGFVVSFQRTVIELKAARLLRIISRRNIFFSIRSAYMGIMWQDLSIDLVAASLRQREFIKRITSNECNGIDTPFALYKANTRYHKFLLLMNRKSKPANFKKNVNLVPTLDIDLLWHTHQLVPVPYRQWCLEHLGTAINHDDTIGQGDLNVGLRDTSLAWFDAYREPYTTDDLRQSYFSTGRKVTGALFPPYGLYMLRKGKKLNQARLGKKKKILFSLLFC